MSKTLTNKPLELVFAKDLVGWTEFAHQKDELAEHINEVINKRLIEKAREDHAKIIRAKAELNAYKKAKAENDDTLQLEIGSLKEQLRWSIVGAQVEPDPEVFEKLKADLAKQIEYSDASRAKRMELARKLMFAIEVLGMVDHVGMPEPYASHIKEALDKLKD